MNASLDLISARSALRSGHFEVARALLIDIVRADPTNGPAWHLLGEAVTDPSHKADCQNRAVAAGYLAALAPELAEPAASSAVEVPGALSFALPAAAEQTWQSAAYVQPMLAPARRLPISAVRLLLMGGAAVLALIAILCVGSALLMPRRIELGGAQAPAAAKGGGSPKEAYAECVSTAGKFMDEAENIAHAPFERSTVQQQGPGKYLVRGSTSYRERGKPVTENWSCTATMMEHGWMTSITY
ncbi:MAG TPA: hypothetical protein VGE07_01920 [Herpetosiphonaceae bacterium]